VNSYPSTSAASSPPPCTNARRLAGAFAPAACSRASAHTAARRRQNGEYRLLSSASRLRACMPMMRFTPRILDHSPFARFCSASFAACSIAARSTRKKGAPSNSAGGRCEYGHASPRAQRPGVKSQNVMHGERFFASFHEPYAWRKSARSNFCGA
jgi:hypothetical protein